MSNSQKALEFKVGIFVLIGLIVVGGLAVYFGRVGEGLKKYYQLTVKLPNAGGLLKNSEVQLSGARIGNVMEKPQIAAWAIGSVEVKLQIYDEVKIPKKATFKVASSGLLGDVFIEVKLPPDFNQDEFDPKDTDNVLQPGDKVAGGSTPGLEELTKKGGETLDDLRGSLGQLKDAVSDLRTKLLTDENAKNVKETLEHVNVASAGFAETSKKLDTVVQGAKEAVEAAKHTMATADTVATELRTTVVDARKTIASGKDALDSIKGLARTATNGEGLLGVLINNREMADNMKALVINLREHGVLFYKNSARESQPQAKPQKPAPRPR